MEKIWKFFRSPWWMVWLVRAAAGDCPAADHASVLGELPAGSGGGHSPEPRRRRPRQGPVGLTPCVNPYGVIAGRKAQSNMVHRAGGRLFP